MAPRTMTEKVDLRDALAAIDDAVERAQASVPHMVAEIDRLLAERDRLATAIEAHRSEFYEVNDYDMAPTRSDEALWAALGEGDET